MTTVGRLDGRLPTSPRALVFAVAGDHLTRVNPRWTELLGWSEDEVMSWPFTDFVHPDDLVAVRDAITHVENGESVVEARSRFRRRDGSWALLEWNGVADGETGGMLGLAREVDLVGELGEQFFENTPAMASLASGDHLIRVNARWMEVLGWSEEDLLTRPFLELVHPDDREATLEAVGHLFAGQRVVAFRNRYRRADGSWALLEWDSVVDPDSGVIYSTTSDVTERAEALAQRDRLQQVLEAVAELQDLYLRHGASRAWWEIALTQLVRVSGSAFGFIGTIEEDGAGSPMLRSLAITNIAWNEWSRTAFDEFAGHGLEFRVLESLYGVTLTTGGVVISDDPATDPRRCGLPEGHPPLRSYVGLPLADASGVVGMVGLANRAGGYDESAIAGLAPLLSVMTHIVARERAEHTMTAARARIADLTVDRVHQQAVTLGMQQIIDAAGFAAGARAARAVVARLAPGAEASVYAPTAPVDDDAMALVEGGPAAVPTVGQSQCRALDMGRTRVHMAGDADPGCAHVSADGPSLVICAPIQTTDELFGLLVISMDPAAAGPAAGSPAMLLLTEAAERLAGALAQVALREQLVGRLLTDELTGLPNRRAFLQAVDRRLHLSILARPFGVLLVDADGFKGINDRFGHQEGDAALGAVADALRASVRDGDVAARIGGDEFAVLVSTTDEEVVRGTASRIIDEVASRAHADAVPLAVSVGGVMVGWDTGAWAEIYAAVDAAMYDAKRAGGGHLFMAPMLGDALAEGP